MQAFSRMLNGYNNPHIQLWEHLRRKTFAALEEHARMKETIDAPEEVYARARMIRSAFLESIGGLPKTSAPLNARAVGSIDRGAYVIEKVIYESQPRVYVTAHFYLPKSAPRPLPGVLFVSGHHRDAKINPEYQAVCHDFAANGFAVLAIDPTGQGERISHLDPDTGKEALQWGTTEHSYQGQQCILTGTSIARYFLWDALRGLDYLGSRPEVDPQRLGVTGNSGGGTQTTLVCMSGDPRVKVAAPCTYVTAREQYYLSGGAQDAEQIQFGMTTNGINFDDMFYPLAPRPLMIGAVESDFFDPDGTQLTYERLKRIYGVLGAGDNVSLVWAPGRHRYAPELRHAAVRWFTKHLHADQLDALVLGEPLEPLPAEELWCTSKGHVRTDFPDARTPYHLNLELIPTRPQIDPDRLREKVIQALRIEERLAKAGPFWPCELQEQEEGGVHVDSITFISEPGIIVSGALLYRGEKPKERVTLFLADGGTAMVDEHIKTVSDIFAAGAAVYIFDVRGTGAVAMDPINAYGDAFPSTFFNSQSWISFCAYMAGDCLLGMRVFDTMRAAAFLREWAGFQWVDIWARGMGPGLIGYLAAALDDTIAETRIEGTMESYESIARTELYPREYGPPLMVHGVLQAFDLPDLKALFKGRALDVRPA